MKYIDKAKAVRATGMTYLGGLTKSVKHLKALKFGEFTYSLYLAPANTSGYEVCPGRTPECTMFCLNESGMNTMTRNDKGDVINSCRIKKTKMFFEHREFFMDWMIAEIQAGIRKANKWGYAFSIRINNTSDISPEEFHRNGQNILEMFPEVQFYDYTKVASRIHLMEKYPNYNVTFSYTGYNLKQCLQMLQNKIKVAVVFKEVPKEFWGYQVIDGDLNDLRYKDSAGVIVGLKYKRVRTKLINNIKFVVQ